MLVLFLIAQFAGLLLTFISFPPGSLSSLAAQQNMQVQQTSSSSFILIFIVEIIAIAIVLFGVKNFYKGRNFYHLLEAYIILFGSFFFFLFIIGDIFPTVDFAYVGAVSAAAALMLYFAKRRKVWNTQSTRNIVTMVSCIGAGVFIGISVGSEFGVLVLYAILGLFAIYDYLAVFVFKFMIPLAKQAVSMDLAFMIGSSELEMLPNSKKADKKYATEALKQIKNEQVRSMVKGGNYPMISSVMLGNGDIILPMAVAAGSYAYTGNLGLAIVITAGAAVGLMATFGILRRYMVGLPAIPPIFAFISLALAVYSFATGAYGILVQAIFVIAAIASLVAMYLTLMRQVKNVSKK